MATPATAATVVVPESVAAGSPVPALIASVTFEVALVRLPNWSRIETVTLPSDPPAAAELGCCAYERWSAAAALIVKALLSAAVRAPSVACSWYPPAALSIERPLKLATPATAATVVVPESVAAGSPVPALIARVTFEVALVWLPYWSRIETVKLPSDAPALVEFGCCVYARWSAAAGLT